MEFFVGDEKGQGKTLPGIDQFRPADTAGSREATFDVGSLNLDSEDVIVASATDIDGNTSEFSVSKVVATA